MDGPFQFLVRATPNGWHLRAVERRLEGEVTIQVEMVDPEELWGAIINAANILLAECKRRSWSDRDVQTLSRMLGRAERGGAA
jgi:hypothetical protein